MKIEGKTIANAPAEKIWKILSEDFLDLHVWMAPIEAVAEKPGAPLKPEFPTKGRVAKIGAKAAKGSSMDETIIKMDHDNYILGLDTNIINMPGPKVVGGYLSEFVVRPIDSERSEVIWRGSAKLGFLGYIMSPMIKKSLSAGFLRGVEELAHFAETGNPHPRKVEALETLRNVA